ncbi:hypothetical protein ACULNC_00965 [Shigella flexneri]
MLKHRRWAMFSTSPALADAQQAIPGIKFDWVVEEGFAQIPSARCR